MGQSFVIGRSTSGGVSSFEDLTEGFALSGNGNKVVGINAGGTALEPKVNSASVAYGGITGTLSDQTDLQAALDAKEDTITDSDDITQGSTNLFLTSAERTKLTNISGTNTGDQDISGISTNASNISTLDTNKADKSNVLELDNTDTFTPTADYHPATKKYVDDAVVGGGGYTDEQAQDAVGGILSAEFTYDDAGNAISINSISADKITDGSTNKAFTATEKTNLAKATLNDDTDISANSWVIDEDNMSSDSATKVPTQQSVKAYVDANSGGGHTTDATLTQATSAYNITGKDVRITLSSGTTGSMNTFIDMSTVGQEGNIVEVKNEAGANYTITTTSLSNFIGGSYIIPNGGVAEFFVRRNLLTTTFDQTTHIHVGNAGAYS